MAVFMSASWGIMVLLQISVECSAKNSNDSAAQGLRDDVFIAISQSIPAHFSWHSRRAKWLIWGAQGNSSFRERAANVGGNAATAPTPGTNNLGAFMAHRTAAF
jgi:hypothetical protein